VSAIFVMSDLPKPWEKYLEINAKHYEANGESYKATAKAHH
jgi:hypothetical protein